MIEKIRTHHNNKEGRIFSWMALILGFTVSCIYPIFPNFVKGIVGTDESVSLFYAAMAIMLFLGAIISPYIFRKVSRTTIVKIALLLSAANFVLLVFVTKITQLYFLETIRLWMKLFLVMTIALFVRDFAKEGDLGKEEGIYFRFSNIGYFIGPLVGGFMAARFGYVEVFFLAATTSILGLIYFYHKHIVQQHPAIVEKKIGSKHSLIYNTKEFFSDKDRLKAYFGTLTLFSWFSFKRIYAPLYIITSGYSDTVSGLFLSLSVIPYILFEVWIGKYADKHGIRIPQTLGFLIIGGFLVAIFFSPFPLLNLGLLLLANIGGSLVEPLQEYYLFKHLPKEKEEDLYGIYMTTDPVSYFLAPALGAVILAFLPFKFLFLIFGGIILFASLCFWKVLKKI
jgi:MFS family permease